MPPKPQKTRNARRGAASPSFSFPFHHIFLALLIVAIGGTSFFSLWMEHRTQQIFEQTIAEQQYQQKVTFLEKLRDTYQKLIAHTVRLGEQEDALHQIQQDNEQGEAPYYLLWKREVLGDESGRPKGFDNATSVMLNNILDLELYNCAGRPLSRHLLDPTQMGERLFAPRLSPDTYAYNILHITRLPQSDSDSHAAAKLVLVVYHRIKSRQRRQAARTRNEYGDDRPGCIDDDTFGFIAIAYDFDRILQAQYPDLPRIIIAPENVLLQQPDSHISHTIPQSQPSIFPSDQTVTELPFHPEYRINPETLKLLQAIRNNNYYLIGGLIVLLIIGALTLSLTVQRPIRKLNDYLKKQESYFFEDRPKRLPTRIPTTPIREFNRVLVHMHDLLTKLDQHHRHLESMKQRYRKQAHTDMLTGLENRTALLELLETLREEAGGSGTVMFRPPLTFALMDIVNFSALNKIYGSQACNQLLRMIGERLGRDFNNNPLVRVYHFSGDEFAILVHGLERPEAERFFCERVHRTLSQLDTRTINMTPILKMRIGVVHIPDTSSLTENLRIPSSQDTGSLGTDWTATLSPYHEQPSQNPVLLHRAELTLTYAKEHRCNCMFYSEELERKLPVYLQADKVNRVRSLEHEHHSELMVEVYPQPIICPRTRRILYNELLARFQDRNGQPVELNEVMPIVQRLNLETTLDQRIIQRAAERLKRGDVPEGQGISLNIEGSTLVRPDLIQLLQPLTPFVKERPITIEVLETSIFDDLDYVRDQLTQIRRAGFRIALDDFGTGHASLDYLLKLPFDTVKFDAQIVSTLMRGTDAEKTLVRDMIHAVKEAGFTTILEGIDTDELERVICGMDCVDAVQGFLFAKPQPHFITTPHRWPCPDRSSSH